MEVEQGGGAAAAPPRRPPSRMLVFRLGGRVLAGATGAGRRVIEVESYTRVPGGPQHLLGLVITGGGALPLVDARPLLGLPAPAWSRPLTACVAEAGELRAAIPVDEVLGLEPWEPQGLESVGEEAPGALRAFALGVAGPRSRRAVLLDLPRILEALRVRRPAAGSRPGRGRGLYGNAPGEAVGSRRTGDG